MSTVTMAQKNYKRSDKRENSGEKSKFASNLKSKTAGKLANATEIFK